MYCRPVCFANSLSQHEVVDEEKLILWGNLNSRGACTSCGASVYYKPLNNSYLASLVLLHICLLFLSSRMMFLKSYCCYLAPEVAFSFSFFKSFHVRVKTTFQSRGVSRKIIRCLLACVPFKVSAHVCRWALNLVLSTNICNSTLWKQLKPC